MGKVTQKKFNNNPKTQRNTRSRPDSPVDEKSLEPPQKKTVTVLNRPGSTDKNNAEDSNVASGSQGNMEVDPHLLLKTKVFQHYWLLKPPTVWTKTKLTTPLKI